MIKQISTSIGTFKGYENDHLFKCLESGQLFDNKLRGWINNNVKSNWTVCDIGANIGVFTIQLANKCRKVYSFEPQKNIYNLLLNNINLNKLTNVTAWSYALFNKDCQMKIADQSKQDGWVGDISDENKITSFGSISLEENELGTIKCKKLDNLINEKIDFIKIDAEGADISIILGAEKLINKYRPIIIFEYNEQLSKANFNTDMNSLNNIIKNNNYKLSKLEEGNWILE